MKKLRRVLLTLVCTAVIPLTSCSLVQRALTFNVIAPVGGDALSLASYAEDTEHFNVGSTTDCYDAFFSNEYDVIVYSLNKGIDLIQDVKVPFKLAKVNTYGNAFLVGKDVEDDSGLMNNSNLVTYDYAYSKYSDHSYENLDTQNNVLKYVYDISDTNTTFIDHFYDDPQAEYEALIEGSVDGKEINYGLLPEPYVTKLVTADPSYHIIQNVTSMFKEKTKLEGFGEDGYSHFPQTGIFVRDTWETSVGDEKELHDNFLTSVQSFTSNIESGNASTMYDYLHVAYVKNQYDVEAYFGDTYQTISQIVDGDTALNGVNACGFCSFSVNVDDFYQESNTNCAYITHGSVDSDVYSSYFNNIDA